jgi:transcription elongation factor/antiterminator RfaH
MSAAWFLVHAKTGREPLAQTNLMRQDFETFLPLTYRTIRHARKIQTRTTAYFSGYLFVQLDLQRDRWRCIDSTTGVLRLVKARERPLQAPQSLVATLKQATDERGVLCLTRNLTAGDQVKLTKGPFADQLGTIESLQPDNRVRVLLSIMSGSVPIDVSRDACAPI